MADSYYQISVAARIPREAPVEATTALIDTWKEKIEEGFKTLQQEAKDTFTKENANDLWNSIQTNLQDAGNKLSELGKDLSQNVQTKIAELNKDAEKKD